MNELLSRRSGVPTTDDGDGKQQGEPRRCWICFGEDQDSEGRWVKPCPCSLVCHEQCLLDWIAENQKGHTMKKVLCPQCGIPYYLFERQSVPLVCLEFLQAVIRSSAPYVTILGLGCSVLIAASTYGAYTVLTLFGAKEGEKWLGHTHSWTWRTFLGLPAIPFVLVASRSRLADGVLPIVALLLLRSNAPVSVSWPPSPALVIGSLPWIRLVYFSILHIIRRRLAHNLQLPSLPRRRVRFSLLHGRQRVAQQDTSSSFARQDATAADRLSSQDAQDIDILFGRDGRDLNVTIMSALLWPTISSLVGNCLRQVKWIRAHFPDAFHRNVLGGCLFVVLKDLASLCYRYERIRQRRSRRIKPFDQ